MQHMETRNPVEHLEETLRHAYVLITSCRNSSYLYNCCMGGKQADRLREVQNEITFYLQLFPLVSFVDNTRTWERLLSTACPLCTTVCISPCQFCKTCCVSERIGPPLKKKRSVFLQPMACSNLFLIANFTFSDFLCFYFLVSSSLYLLDTSLLKLGYTTQGSRSCHHWSLQKMYKKNLTQRNLYEQHCTIATYYFNRNMCVNPHFHLPCFILKLRFKMLMEVFSGILTFCKIYVMHKGFLSAVFSFCHQGKHG